MVCSPDVRVETALITVSDLRCLFCDCAVQHFLALQLIDYITAPAGGAGALPASNIAGRGDVGRSSHFLWDLYPNG